MTSAVTTTLPPLKPGEWWRLACRRWRLWLIAAVAALVPSLPDLLESTFSWTLTSSPVLSALAAITLISTANFVDTHFVLRDKTLDSMTKVGNSVFGFASGVLATFFVLAAWSASTSEIACYFTVLNVAHSDVIIFGAAGVFIAILGEGWLVFRLWRL